MSSKKTIKIAKENNINTLNKFFNYEVAKEINEKFSFSLSMKNVFGFCKTHELLQVLVSQLEKSSEYVKFRFKIRC